MTVTVTIGTRANCNGGSSLAPSMSGLTIGDTVVVPWCLSRGDTAGTALSPPSGWSAAENPAAPGTSGTYQPISGIFYKTAASTTETCTIPGIPGGSYGYADILSGHSTLGTLVLSSAHTNNGAASGVTSGNTGTTSSVSGTENFAVAMVHPEDQVGNVSAMSFPPATGWTDIGHDQANSVINAYAAGYKIGVTGTQQGSNTWTTNAGYSACVAVFEVASSGTNVNPGVGSVAISGHAPTIAQPHSATPDAGSVTLYGHAPTIGQPHSASPGVGSVAITGYAPGISQPHGVSPGVGSIAITGYAPTITQSGAQSVAPGAGSVVLTGYAPTVTQGSPAPEPTRNAGFELGPRFVSFKPLLQRILEARAERRVKPAKERAAKRAKVIEVQAAELVLQDDGAETRFRELMAGWLAQRPVIPPVVAQVDPMQLFMAQVAFRIQQMQAEEQARVRLAAQDEEEALIALLLA